MPGMCRRLCGDVNDEKSIHHSRAGSTDLQKTFKDINTQGYREQRQNHGAALTFNVYRLESASSIRVRTVQVMPL